MRRVFRPKTTVLFIGDLCFFIFSLWLSLYLRAFEAPSKEIFVTHLSAFSVLFLVWVGVFFIAGLYESRSIILARRAFSATLLIAQICNITLAALFFFFVPLYGLAPKTILFIYLIISFLLILVWRVWLYPLLGIQKPEHSIMVGEGPEVEQLYHALADAHRAPAKIVALIKPSETPVIRAVTSALERHKPRFIIADFTNPQVAEAFPELYNLLTRGLRFFDAMELYEEVFGRVPLSVIADEWIARNVSGQAHVFYDTLKRLMDVVIALVLGSISLVFYPLLALLIKLQDGGKVFYHTERVGQNGKVFVMHKFRTMNGADRGVEALKSKLVVTPVGSLLRKVHLDELPQLWNVLKGEMSLIGPRPELPALVATYEAQIPYYGIRHLVKPGLSGWARLYHASDPHHGAEVEATREKFSYDLYYLKHRSFLLDVTVALKTIKKLLGRSGV